MIWDSKIWKKNIIIAIYNYDINKKLICALVDHGGERYDGKITIESVCEPKKEKFKNYDSDNNNYINFNSNNYNLFIFKK